jgi:hypothetical protein
MTKNDTNEFLYILHVFCIFLYVFHMFLCVKMCFLYVFHMFLYVKMCFSCVIFTFSYVKMCFFRYFLHNVYNRAITEEVARQLNEKLRERGGFYM